MDLGEFPEIGNIIDSVKLGDSVYIDGECRTYQTGKMTKAALTLIMPHGGKVTEIVYYNMHEKSEAESQNIEGWRRLYSLADDLEKVFRRHGIKTVDIMYHKF